MPITAARHRNRTRRPRRGAQGLAAAVILGSTIVAGGALGAAPPSDAPIPPAPAAATVPADAPTLLPGLDARLVGAPLEPGPAADAARDRTDAVAKVDALQSELRSLAGERDRVANRLVVLDRNLAVARTDLVTAQTRARELAVATYKGQGVAPELATFVPAPNVGDLARRVKYADRIAAILLDEIRDARSRVTKAERDVEQARTDAASVQQRTTVAQAALPHAAAAADRTRAAVQTTLADATVAGLDIPLITLDAYLRADAVTAAFRPDCRLAWWGLAGVGRVESNHGRHGGKGPDATGTVSPPILGAPLDGSGVGGNTGAIAPPDGGVLSGNPQFDRALGPMQFITGTWLAYQVDGNADGVADPQNVYDAALAAAAYLCHGAAGLALDDDAGLRVAYLAYNHSSEYVATVLDHAHAYRDTGLPAITAAYAAFLEGVKAQR